MGVGEGGGSQIVAKVQAVEVAKINALMEKR